MSSNSSELKCPYCGSSTYIIRKGFRHNQSGSLQLYLCKPCNKRFPENTRKAKEVPDDLVATYLFDVMSLKSLLKTNENLKLSRTTLYRRIREKAKQCPGWEELVKAGKRQENWGSVMGIDTTCLKIRGAPCVYLHVADVMSHDPLAYNVCARKDVATIEPILRKLKNLEYNPRIVVSDLAPEILASVRNVLPNAILQGCIFHVSSWLNKELPTKKMIKNVGREKVVLWRKIKAIINYACISKNESIRQRYLGQLKSLSLDEKARSVVERFLDHLEYYHTRDELQGYGSNILYDNLCECHIGMITRLESKFMGFKGNIEATNNIIRLFWYLYRKSRTVILTKEEDVSLHYMPLTLFCDCVNIPEVSEASGISKEILTRTALRTGLTIAGDYAFTENKLKDIEKIVLKMGKTSLGTVMQTIGFNQTTTMELLEKLGFSQVFKSLHPSDIIVSSPRHE